MPDFTSSHTDGVFIGDVLNARVNRYNYPGAKLPKRLPDIYTRRQYDYPCHYVSADDTYFLLRNECAGWVLYRWNANATSYYVWRGMLSWSKKKFVEYLADFEIEPLEYNIDDYTT